MNGSLYQARGRVFEPTGFAAPPRLEDSPRGLCWGLLLLALLPACQQQMASQPSYRPDQPSSFFPDGRAARPPVPGTVARGQLKLDTAFFTGRRSQEIPELTTPATIVATGAGSSLAMAVMLGANQIAEENSGVEAFPFPVTAKVLQHGQNRYTIYCAVCHDVLGTGHGMIVERGYTPPPSYHRDRLRKAPVGHFFQVITRGYGSMPAYGSQVPPYDRWAIIAYIRALQLSQHFSEHDLPPDLRREWRAAQAAGKGPTP